LFSDPWCQFDLRCQGGLAAHRQGKYLPFDAALMESKGTLTDNGILDAASRLGFDLTRLKADMTDPAIQVVQFGVGHPIVHHREDNTVIPIIVPRRSQ